jgi:hypothetical protein
MTTVAEMLFDNPADGVAALTHELEIANVLAGGLIPGGDAAAAIVGLLDTPVESLVIPAWAKFTAVQRACAETRAQPGSRQQIRAGHHTIQSTQHPRLEAEIDNTSIPVLTLDLIVSLTVDAIVATVAAGRVVTVALGEVNAQVTLKCGDATLAQRAVNRVVLPDVIDIDALTSKATSRPPEQLGTRPETLQ